MGFRLPQPPEPLDPSRALLRSAVQTLLEFTNSPTPFAVSNHSLQALLEVFSDRLDKVEGIRDAEALMRLWRQRMNAVRADVLPTAKLVRFPDGGTIALLSEDDAAKISSFCPDKPDF